MADVAFFITYHKFHSVILQESRGAICFCFGGWLFGLGEGRMLCRLLLFLYTLLNDALAYCLVVAAFSRLVLSVPSMVVE